MNGEANTYRKHPEAGKTNKYASRYLVMHQLMTYWDLQVEYDVQGKYVTATDTEGRHYMFLVAMRDLTRESQSIKITKDAYDKFHAEVEGTDKIPVVALVVLTKSGHLYTVLVNAFDFDDMSSQKNSAIQISNAEEEGFSVYVGEMDKPGIQSLLDDERTLYVDLKVEKDARSIDALLPDKRK